MIGWSLVVNASVVFFWNNVAVSGSVGVWVFHCQCERGCLCQCERWCFIVGVSVGVSLLV